MLGLRVRNVGEGNAHLAGDEVLERPNPVETCCVEKGGILIVRFAILDALLAGVEKGGIVILRFAILDALLAGVAKGGILILRFAILDAHLAGDQMVWHPRPF